MAATIAIEIESGVFTGPVRQHPGYYAGDFSPRPSQDELTLTAASMSTRFSRQPGLPRKVHTDGSRPVRGRRGD